MSKSEDIFFFIHCQKTGGTSLFFQLVREFGPHNVIPRPFKKVKSEIVESIDIAFVREKFEEKRERTKLIAGHYPFFVTEQLGVNFKRFTILREPVSRTISFLEHYKKFHGLEKSIIEIYNDEDLRESLINNHMVKMFALDNSHSEKGALTKVDLDEHHLKLAKTNLQKLDAVGLQEEFSLFSNHLCQKFDWDFEEIMIVNKTSDAEKSHLRDNAKLLARIREDNQLDINFYEFARQQFSLKS